MGPASDFSITRFFFPRTWESLASAWRLEDLLLSLTYAFKQVQQVLARFFPNMIGINARMWSHASGADNEKCNVEEGVEDHWRKAEGLRH